MKYLNFFKPFNIDKICRKYNITNYTINKDGSIDVDSNTSLIRYNLTKFPLKFNNVNGYFFCHNNRLTSLEGGPQNTNGFYDCSYNELKSLKGSPKNVGGDFDCSKNKLSSLEGGPLKVVGDFFCQNNRLTSLKGGPDRVGYDFYCYDNQITTFEGFPKNVGGNFYCDNNPIFEIWELFQDKTKIELFNDMDIIQDGVVILDRLNYFLEEIEKDPKGAYRVKSLKRYKYI